MLSLKFSFVFLFVLPLMIPAPSHNSFDAMRSFNTEEDGRRQYALIVKRTQMPNYGICWKNAVNALENDCGNLSDNLQSKLALMFTDCFLEMSGEVIYNCQELDSLDSRQICVRGMSDRAFNSYTEFYTHTQNICFFLKNQVWQETAEVTIERLSSTSNQISFQLEEAQKSHKDLLKHQKAYIDLQKTLIESSKSLGQSLIDSKSTVKKLLFEVRTSTAEQQGALGALSQRLAALQAWAIGEVSWIESLIFYALSVLVSYLMTSLKRTHGARIWIMLLLALGISIEQLIHHLIVKNSLHDDLAMFFLKEDLYYYIWKWRAFVLALCMPVYIYTIYSYTDLAQVNHCLLLSIQSDVARITNIFSQREEAVARGSITTSGENVPDRRRRSLSILGTSDIPFINTTPEDGENSAVLHVIEEESTSSINSNSPTPPQRTSSRARRIKMSASSTPLSSSSRQSTRFLLVEMNPQNESPYNLRNRSARN